VKTIQERCQHQASFLDGISANDVTWGALDLLRDRTRSAGERGEVSAAG
jgi:hypothetical protein